MYSHMNLPYSLNSHFYKKQNNGNSLQYNRPSVVATMTGVMVLSDYGIFCHTCIHVHFLSTFTVTLHAYNFPLSRKAFCVRGGYNL